MKFSGKNVLVTGSSRGIGAQIAKTLAGFGLKVWINYRSATCTYLLHKPIRIECRYVCFTTCTDYHIIYN